MAKLKFTTVEDSRPLQRPHFVGYDPAEAITLENWYVRAESEENTELSRTILVGTCKNSQEQYVIPLTTIIAVTGTSITTTAAHFILDKPDDRYLSYISRFCLEKWDPENPIRLEKNVQSPKT